MNIECVAPIGDQCGEAACWVPDEAALYWTDVNRFLVHRLNPVTGDVRTWHFDEPCVALFRTDKPGLLLLGIGSKLIRWWPVTDKREDHGFALSDWPTARLNDGRPGPNGEVWLGTMQNNVAADGTPGVVDQDMGVLFKITDGLVQSVKSGIGISNTVCFSPDHKHFYFGDSPRNVIWRFDYDMATGTVGNETEFFAGFDRGAPDGSTIDAEGYLWNCRFDGGCVVRIAPDGSVDRVVEMPVSNLTTCEFGGVDLATLYITSAAMMTTGYERLAGSLFACRPGVAGAAPLSVTL